MKTFPCLQVALALERTAGIVFLIALITWINGVMDGYMSGSNSYYWNTVYNLGYDLAQNGGIRTSDILP